MDQMQKPLIVPVFVPHGGCPHRCVFCNQSLITGTRAAALCPTDIRQQITAFLQGCRRSSRPSQIAFYGGNFLGLPPLKVTELLSEAARFVAEGKIGGIRFSTRPDTIDPERMALLSEFPVQTVEIGAQSMDNRVLAMSRRGHTAADTARAAGLVKENGYELGLQVMVGLPGDDEDISMETARRVVDLSPDFVRIYPTLVVADSRLADWYREGAYVSWTLERAVSMVTRMLLFFQQHKIRVIRMGLQATEDLQPGDTILSGPYHPAFGHLVFSQVLLGRAEALLASRLGTHCRDGASEVVLSVHPRIESQLRGLKNENLRKLERRFGVGQVIVRKDSELAEGEVTAEISVFFTYPA